MFPAARLVDPVTHDMIVPSGIIGPPLAPPMGGPVIIEGMPAAYVTCTTICTGVISVGLIHPPPPPGTPPLPIIKGSLTVHIYNLPAARWVPSMDIAVCGVFLGDPKLTSMRTVFIGDVGAGFASVGGPVAAFMKAAQSGAALVCKGPCKACGHI